MDLLIIVVTQDESCVKQKNNLDFGTGKHGHDGMMDMYPSDSQRSGFIGKSLFQFVFFNVWRVVV